MADKECQAGANLNLTCVIEGDQPIDAMWRAYDKEQHEWVVIKPCLKNQYGAGACRRDHIQALQRGFSLETKTLKNRRGLRLRLTFTRVESRQQTRYRCAASNRFNQHEAMREIKVTVISEWLLYFFI